ncbi:MAG: DUF4230 domain-containing protein [Bacteroidia bacterium]
MRRVYLLLLCAVIFSSCKKNKERYLVISKIQSASKLATTESTLNKIVFGTQEKKLLWLIRLNEARFVAYTKATVLSGIDLSELNPDDIKIEDGRIEIVLPNVKVLDFQYPFSSYKIDSSITENAFLNKLDIKDHEHFYQLAELDIRNNLSHMGIKEATEEKTRNLITGLLKNLGYEEIYIKFKPGKFIEELDLLEEEKK